MTTSDHMINKSLLYDENNCVTAHEEDMDVSVTENITKLVVDNDDCVTLLLCDEVGQERSSDQVGQDRSSSSNNSSAFNDSGLESLDSVDKSITSHFQDHKTDKSLDGGETHHNVVTEMVTDDHEASSISMKANTRLDSDDASMQNKCQNQKKRSKIIPHGTVTKMILQGLTAEKLKNQDAEQSSLSSVSSLHQNNAGEKANTDIKSELITPKQKLPHATSLFDISFDERLPIKRKRRCLFPSQDNKTDSLAEPLSPSPTKKRYESIDPRHDKKVVVQVNKMSPELFDSLRKRISVVSLHNTRESTLKLQSKTSGVNCTLCNSSKKQSPLLMSIRKQSGKESSQYKCRPFSANEKRSSKPTNCKSEVCLPQAKQVNGTLTMKHTREKTPGKDMKMMDKRNASVRKGQQSLSKDKTAGKSKICNKATPFSLFSDSKVPRKEYSNKAHNDESTYHKSYRHTNSNKLLHKFTLNKTDKSINQITLTNKKSQQGVPIKKVYKETSSNKLSHKGTTYKGSQERITDQKLSHKVNMSNKVQSKSTHNNRLPHQSLSTKKCFDGTSSSKSSQKATSSKTTSCKGSLSTKMSHKSSHSNNTSHQVSAKSKVLNHSISRQKVSINSHPSIKGSFRSTPKDAVSHKSSSSNKISLKVKPSNKVLKCTPSNKVSHKSNSCAKASKSALTPRHKVVSHKVSQNGQAKMKTPQKVNHVIKLKRDTSSSKTDYKGNPSNKILYKVTTSKKTSSKGTNSTNAHSKLCKDVSSNKILYKTSCSGSSKNVNNGTSKKSTPHKTANRSTNNTVCKKESTTTTKLKHKGHSSSTTHPKAVPKSKTDSGNTKSSKTSHKINQTSKISKQVTPKTAPNSTKKHFPKGTPSRTVHQTKSKILCKTNFDSSSKKEKTPLTTKSKGQSNKSISSNNTSQSVQTRKTNHNNNTSDINASSKQTSGKKNADKTTSSKSSKRSLGNKSPAENCENYVSSKKKLSSQGTAKVEVNGNKSDKKSGHATKDESSSHKMTLRRRLFQSPLKERFVCKNTRLDLTKTSQNSATKSSKLSPKEKICKRVDQESAVKRSVAALQKHKQQIKKSSTGMQTRSSSVNLTSPQNVRFRVVSAKDVPPKQLKKKLPHCCYCEKFQCLTQKKLDEHIKECHKFHCFKCKKVFTNKEELLQHRADHVTEKHHCLLCQKFYTSQHRYEVHLTGREHNRLVHAQRTAIDIIYKACLQRNIAMPTAIQHSMLTLQNQESLQASTQNDSQTVERLQEERIRNFYYQSPDLQKLLDKIESFDSCAPISELFNTSNAPNTAMVSCTDSTVQDHQTMNSSTTDVFASCNYTVAPGQDSENIEDQSSMTCDNSMYTSTNVISSALRVLNEEDCDHLYSAASQDYQAENMPRSSLNNLAENPTTIQEQYEALLNEIAKDVLNSYDDNPSFIENISPQLQPCTTSEVTSTGLFKSSDEYQQGSSDYSIQGNVQGSTSMSHCTPTTCKDTLDTSHLSDFFLKDFRSYQNLDSNQVDISLTEGEIHSNDQNLVNLQNMDYVCNDENTTSSTLELCKSQSDPDTLNDTVLNQANLLCIDDQESMLGALAMVPPPPSALDTVTMSDELDSLLKKLAESQDDDISSMIPDDEDFDIPENDDDAYATELAGKNKSGETAEVKSTNEIVGNDYQNDHMKSRQVDVVRHGIADNGQMSENADRGVSPNNEDQEHHNPGLLGDNQDTRPQNKEDHNSSLNHAETETVAEVTNDERSKPQFTEALPENGDEQDCDFLDKCNVEKEYTSASTQTDTIDDTVKPSDKHYETDSVDTVQNCVKEYLKVNLAKYQASSLSEQTDIIDITSQAESICNKKHDKKISQVDVEEAAIKRDTCVDKVVCQPHNISSQAEPIGNKKNDQDISSRHIKKVDVEEATTKSDAPLDTLVCDPQSSFPCDNNLNKTDDNEMQNESAGDTDVVDLTCTSNLIDLTKDFDLENSEICEISIDTLDLGSEVEINDLSSDLEVVPVPLPDSDFQENEKKRAERCLPVKHNKKLLNTQNSGSSLILSGNVKLTYVGPSQRKHHNHEKTVTRCILSDEEFAKLVGKQSQPILVENIKSSNYLPDLVTPESTDGNHQRNKRKQPLSKEQSYNIAETVGMKNCSANIKSSNYLPDLVTPESTDGNHQRNKRKQPLSKEQSYNIAGTVGMKNCSAKRMKLSTNTKPLDCDNRYIDETRNSVICLNPKNEVKIPIQRVAHFNPRWDDLTQNVHNDKSNIEKSDAGPIQPRVAYPGAKRHERRNPNEAHPSLINRYADQHAKNTDEGWISNGLPRQNSLVSSLQADQPNLSRSSRAGISHDSGVMRANGRAEMYYGNIPRAPMNASFTPDSCYHASDASQPYTMQRLNTYMSQIPTQPQSRVSNTMQHNYPVTVNNSVNCVTKRVFPKKRGTAQRYDRQRQNSENQLRHTPWRPFATDDTPNDMSQTTGRHVNTNVSQANTMIHNNHQQYQRPHGVANFHNQVRIPVNRPRNVNSGQMGPYSAGYSNSAASNPIVSASSVGGVSTYNARQPSVVIHNYSMANIPVIFIPD